MRKLFIKLFIALLPLIVVVAIYFINDPFMVVYHHKSFVPSNGIPVVTTNDDYIATETFLNQYQQRHYDSYVFGNSRGKTYHIAEWKKYLPSGSSCFQYAVSNENIYGIERKLNFIDQHGMTVKNALIILDQPVYAEVAEDKNFPKHPSVTGTSMFQFQFRTFRGYFDADFLSQYLAYLATKKVKTSIFSGVLNNERYYFDETTNDATPADKDNEIDRDTGTYYQARSVFFKDRDTIQRYTPKTIGPAQLALLNKIKAYLDKFHTSYKIVISPGYDQLKTNADDQQILYSIFGKENIYDFSGINDITASKYNYYENTHYRIRISNRIMDSIYKKDVPAALN